MSDLQDNAEGQGAGSAPRVQTGGNDNLLPNQAKGTASRGDRDLGLSYAAVSSAPLSAHQLKKIEFEPLDFVVQGLIPTGLTILAGLPKAGKSWLGLDMALSVSRGVGCLGERTCPKGDVLYLGLEDSDRRLKTRLEQMLGMGPAWPRGLFFKTDWPRADEGGIDQLTRWVAEATNPRLVIIDVFEKFRSQAGRQGNSYQRDYQDLAPLQTLARNGRIAIVLVHHLRKTGSAGDPFERITGSTGFTGSADTIVMLDRGRAGTRLYARGRDIEDVSEPVAFDTGAMCWRVLKQAEPVSLYQERDRIVSLLQGSGEPMSPSAIAIALGQTSSSIRTMLSRMNDRGEIQKAGRGRYTAIARAA